MGKKKNPSDTDIFSLVEAEVFKDNSSNDPDHVAQELGLDWSESNAMAWDMRYERCSECEHWCECGELADENRDTVPCQECRPKSEEE